MVNSCVCFGCNNSNLSGHRVHRFPNKKHKDFSAWIRFVQAKRSNFAASSLTRHTVVCEKHFTPDSYNQGDLMEFRMGFRRKEWVRLANGAVPSVHAGPPAKFGGSEESNVNVNTRRESARRKRELCTRVLPAKTGAVQLPLQILKMMEMETYLQWTLSQKWSIVDHSAT